VSQVLPKGWVTSAIEDLLAPLEDGRILHQGWSPQCEKSPSESGEEWGVLKTTAIQPGAFLPSQNKRLPADLTPRPNIEVKVGDVLLTCAGPRSRCGVACLVRGTRQKLMLSGKMYRFRVPEEQVDARYLEAFLQTSAAHSAIDRMKTGGSDSGLNLTHERFRRLEVPVAPLNEQRRIVEAYEELVSDLDAGVAALERVREKLKLYRASVLRAAAEGALTAGWRAEHPHTELAAQLLKRVAAERRSRWEEDQLAKFEAKGQKPPKNWKAQYTEPVAPDTAHLPSLPETWCWATIDQVSALVQYGSSAKTDGQAEGVPVLRMGNIRPDGSLDLTDLKYLPADHAEFPALLLQPDDLLFNRTNSAELVGKTGRYQGTPHPCSFASYLIRVRVLDGVLPAIVAHTLNGLSGRRWIKKVANQTVGQANVNGSKLAAFAFPLAPAGEQEAIAEAVEDQISVIEHLEGDLDAKLRSAQALRQSILCQAFTGRLVPQDVTDEPASELLKRIAAERGTRARAAVVKRHVSSTRTDNHAGAGRRGRPPKNRGQ
jgi:type I restriction enzyme S subunit